MPSVAWAGSLPSRFTLGNYVPDRAWFFVHVVDNPDRAWIDQQWSEVIDAFKNSGIDRDITSLILSLMSDEDRAKAQTTIDKVTTLLRGVRWGDLVKHEIVFAEGVSPTPTGYGYVVLTRGAEGSGAANLAGFVAILKEIAALSPKFALTESKVEQIEVWTMRLGDKPENPTVALDVFRKGDVVGMAIDPPMGDPVKATRQTFEDVSALLNGKSTKKSFVASARFQEALSQVKPPQDCIVFFDAKVLFSDLSRMFERFEAMAIAKQAKKQQQAAPNGAAPTPAERPAERAQAKDDEDDADVEGLGVLRKVLSLVDFLDYVVSTIETQGRRELTHEVTRLQPGKEASPLVPALLVRKPFERFDQFIPADATGFSLDGFIDLGAFYKLAMDFIVKEVPAGPQVVAKIEAVCAQLGFHPQRDLFDWWSGETISIEMPAAVVTPMGGADSVTLIRVRNSEVAAQKINTAIDFIKSKLQAEGQMLMVTPAKVNAEGFREVTHPMFAMFLRPVIGVQGDWLMIGSSAGALNKCLDVAAGKAPSIKENKRFQAEGLIPSGPVLAASFKDTSNYGQELAGVIAMVGMVGGIVTGTIPEKDEEAKKFKQVAQSALGIVMKLGPILQQIDFYSSESSISTYDGKLTLRTESVITYKDPAACEATAKKP
jgi:hypothetical protein